MAPDEAHKTERIGDVREEEEEEGLEVDERGGEGGGEGGGERRTEGEEKPRKENEEV